METPSGDCGPPSSIYKGQKPDRAQQVWESEVDPSEGNPYRNEWNDLVDAVRRVRAAQTQAAKTAALLRLEGLDEFGEEDPSREALLDIDNFIDYLIVNV